jgi:hypothetical protein
MIVHLVLNLTFDASRSRLLGLSGWNCVRVPDYTICSSSRAYARDDAMSFCLGISTGSSPFRGKVIVPEIKCICQPRFG